MNRNVSMNSCRAICTSIIKRAKAQKKNPYKQEIFTDQRDFREAMERA